MLKKIASHTNQELDQSHLAPRNAILDQLLTGMMISITAKRLLTLDALLTSNLNFITMDPWKLDSWFIKILCHINQEFTDTLQEDSLEDMPSKSLDGVLKTELNTGSAKTHGDHLGEKKDTSESPLENVELTKTSGLAKLTLDLVTITIKYF